MLALRESQAVPLDTKLMSTFGNTPWQGGFHGCGCDPVGGCHCTPGLGGFHAGHGGGSHSGMGRSSISYASFRGLHQGTSLDQIIANTFNWLGGMVQTQLPVSASVPPQYGSSGAISTQLQAWLPYIIIGFLAYKVIK